MKENGNNGPATGTDRHSRPGRFIGAVAFGFLAALLLSEAIRAGASFAYQHENAFEEWRQVVWGEHWLIRAVAALISCAAGAFIAGVVARHRGGFPGLLSSTPFVTLWGVASYFAWHSDIAAPPGYRFVAPVLLAGIPYVAFHVGHTTASLGRTAAPHFDSRPGTLLGIRWYHFFWILFLANLVIIQSTWAVLYALSLLKAGLLREIIPSILFFGVAATLLLTFNGLRKAYLVLAGFDLPSNTVTLDVLKFGFGYRNSDSWQLPDCLWKRLLGLRTWRTRGTCAGISRYQLLHGGECQFILLLEQDDSFV